MRIYEVSFYRGLNNLNRVFEAHDTITIIRNHQNSKGNY